MKTLLVSLLLGAALPDVPSSVELEPALVESGISEASSPSGSATYGPVRAEPAPLLTLRALEASAPRLIEEVSFDELRQTPSRFAGRSVRCAVQVAELDIPFDSFLSRFDSAQDLCFSAWGDEQRIWHREEFENTATRLFVPRGSVLEARVLAAGSHERLLLTLRVREIWLNQPWIEVESAVLLSPSVGEGTILHASRAMDLWKTGQRELAIGELERALASPLPTKVHAALEEELDLMREELASNPERLNRPLPPGENTIYRLDLR